MAESASLCCSVPPCAAPPVPPSTMPSQHKQETLQTPGEWTKPFTHDLTLIQLKALWLCGSQKCSNEPLWHHQVKRWLQLENATLLLTAFALSPRRNPTPHGRSAHGGQVHTRDGLWESNAVCSCVAFTACVYTVCWWVQCATASMSRWLCMCAGFLWCLPEGESPHYYQVRPHRYHHTSLHIHTYIHTYKLLSGYGIGPVCTKCTVCACLYVCASVDSVLGTQWTSVQRKLPAAPLTQSCTHTYSLPLN